MVSRVPGPAGNTEPKKRRETQQADKSAAVPPVPPYLLFRNSSLTDIKPTSLKNNERV